MSSSGSGPLRPLRGRRGTRRFHVMIKAGGAACNLACDYCYYLHKRELLGQPDRPVMDDATLETFIRQYIDGTDSPSVVFSWQGGEPTLLGLPFFEKALRLQRRYTPPGRTCANTLQTNGVLITEDWAAFLKEHDFLVGFSIDGPEALHDLHRRDRAGKPTFARVMAGFARLRRHGVPFTTLTTVNRDNARSPLEVYDFLRGEMGATYIQFNPCVEPTTYERLPPASRARISAPRLGAPRTGRNHKGALVTDWSVDPDDWGDFLCAVFDAWLERDLGRVLVNYFETAVAQSLGLPAQICPTGEICGKGVAIEQDGRVYACDHYVYPEHCLGSIHDQPLADMVFSERQKAFGFAKRNTLPASCLHCPHGLLCWGQCPRHRLLSGPRGDAGLNYLCAGFKKFYAHATPAIRAVAAQCRQTRRGGPS